MRRHCELCEDPPNIKGIKVYQACEILDGNPCLPCQQHIALETEISVAKEALNNLLARRQNLRTEINYQHDPVIYRLPTELTARIFEAYVEIDPEEPDWETKETGSPLLLGSVCRPWRRIAWSSPQLWSHIHISIPTPEHRRSIDVPQEWIDRSAELPLSIYVKISCCDIWQVASPTGTYLPFIKMVNRYSHRWEDFRIQCYPNLLAMFSGDAQGAPLLRTMCLSIYEWDEVEVEDSYSIDSNESCAKPRPSHVELSRIQFKLVDINWNNITDATFYMNSICLDDCVVLLRQAPQLRNFVINGVEDPEQMGWQEQTFPQEPIIHHGLQRFTFWEYKGNNLELFFNSFAFPALTHLNVRNIADESLSSYIIALFTRSPTPRITHLDVTNAIRYDYQTLINILETTPFLPELSIPDVLTDAETLDFLRFLGATSIFNTSDDPRNHFLPKLQIITYLSAFNTWDVSFWEVLSQLFGPRGIDVHNSTTGRRPLKKISIIMGLDYFEDENPPVCLDREIVERLVELSQSGVIFDLNNSGTDLFKQSIQYHGMSI
ncbi:hypothetical protein CVT25_004953 [Psilocybe cyanescens]|uniref:Uncharacterized protein n=1 Tax=Psilocybe cyanescens TaxID=93625 RepID=A0A409XUC6_PSICY|nr:hypothetical protein CVT25_004953 [Psilocybe cyanescens]